MDDPNTPSWLKESNTMEAAAAPSSGGLDPVATSTTTTTPAAPTASTTTSTNDEADLPGMILMMRLANIGAAGMLIACSILVMTTIPAVSAFILAIYATCGGILICCLETQLKFVRVMIAVNFGFLFNFFWRFIFYMILGSVAWSYKNLFGRVVACVFLGVALLNTYVLCRYPSYRRVREQIAEEEDKRIEARISKEVKRQAAKQIMK